LQFCIHVPLFQPNVRDRRCSQARAPPAQEHDAPDAHATARTGKGRSAPGPAPGAPASGAAGGGAAGGSAALTDRELSKLIVVTQSRGRRGGGGGGAGPSVDEMAAVISDGLQHYERELAEVRAPTGLCAAAEA